MFEEGGGKWHNLSASLCTEQEEIINIVYSGPYLFLTTFHIRRHLEEKKFIHR